VCVRESMCVRVCVCVCVSECEGENSVIQYTTHHS